jgi:hypothetical protein
MAKVVTYECDQCGCEVVVKSAPETEMMPIYCCGMEVTEVSPAKKKAAKPKKKVAKKVAKKVVKKQVSKKKPAARKKTARKS